MQGKSCLILLILLKLSNCKDKIMFKLFKLLPLIIIISLLSFYFIYLRAIDSPVSESDSQVIFSIEKGEGVSLISANLLDNNLISSELFFKIYLWRSQLDKKLQAGKYTLTPSMSMKEIVDVFVYGNVLSNEIDIKIIEGWSLDDIATSLEKNNQINSDDFLKLAEAPLSKWNFNFPKPVFLDGLSKNDLEGYIFPDTYRVFENSRSSDLIKRSLDNFDKKLSSEMREDIKRQNKTIHEIITMASIIEKEVINDEDKKLVSGILNKRLEIGMMLQVDSTINYITGKNDPGALLADLKIDSPYNTYKYYGLPPGPICNPGLSSIMAAIYPTDSEYLFYLNRQDTLETIFSKTYEEHLRNKNKYLR